MRSILSAALVGCFAIGCGSSEAPAPAENPDADVDSGDAGDPSAVGTLGQPCDKPGALACGGHAQKLQLICDGGFWKSNGVCPGSQICDTRPGPTAGSCQDPDPKCVGKKPGESFCDGAVRRTCGPDLLSSTTETCPSAEHCAQSSGPHCAKCLDGKFLCEGAVLKKCKADHTDFAVAETCATAALCVDAYGKCLPPACAVGDYRCDGDVLQSCRPTRIDWDPVKVCPKGMCDATAKDCRECVSGSKECAAGNTPRSCDSTGHWVSLAPCSTPTPLCKAGICAPGTCVAGEYRCSTDTLETCNSTFDGFDPVKVCAAGLCDAVSKECDDCKTGTADCLGSTPRACDSTGHWKSLTACSGSTPVCKAGICSAGVCVSGEYRCSVDTLETCNSTFTAFDPVKVCGSGLCDALGKECDDCKSGETTCSGATPRACDSTGHWKDLTPCSGSTPYCTGGVCSSCLPGLTSCSGSCVDLKTDPANCGTCGKACASGESCSAGICTAVPKCNSGTLKVLIYGPVGSLETPYLPAGSISTVATETMWKAMTTADFKSYQLIVIGEGSYGSAPPWDAANFNKSTWTPAVTGRIVVSTLDPAAHGTSGATTFARAALDWASKGPGTGLYVGPDYGSRKLDFMSGFGTWTALGQIGDGVTGDDVSIIVPAHGTMAGSTSASLSTWGSSYHGAITGFPTAFTVIARSTLTPSRAAVVANDPKCVP